MNLVCVPGGHGGHHCMCGMLVEALFIVILCGWLMATAQLQGA